MVQQFFDSDLAHEPPVFLGPFRGLQIEVVRHLRGVAAGSWPDRVNSRFSNVLRSRMMLSFRGLPSASFI
ncbi:hypothetical protein AR456_18755 [Halomonas huangheensis]|nr:hypothetical protein AR456_18755 [Halomonas huangheensis]